MQLNFTVMQEITTGDFPAAYHDQDGIVSVYTVQDGHIHQIQAQPELGEWDGLLFSPATTVGVDESIENIKVRGLPHEKLWFTWKSGDLRMIAPWPDDSPPYEQLDPYRLYYAVDSEKLYMNISQRWQFIGSLRHDLLKNIGTLSHDELEAAMAELRTIVENIQVSLGNIPEKIEEHSTKLQKLSSDINGHEVQLLSISTEQGLMNTRLDELEDIVAAITEAE